MLVTTAPKGKRRLGLLFLACALCACSKKSDSPEADRTKAPEPPPAGAAPPMEASADSAPLAEAGREGAPATADPAPAPRREAAPAFRSQPPPKAWPGRRFAYTVRLVADEARGPARLRLLRGPDSMILAGAVVEWTPRSAGTHPVVLEAYRVTASGDTLRAKQAFTLEVLPVLSLTLAPLPAQADKGDSVLFDLSGSRFPDWAGPSLRVRFDYDGDGAWDTPALPLAAHLRHRHAYGRTGTFSPKVEARYLDLESREARGALAVVGAVDAVLRLSADTVEPGGILGVDASASKGDGRLVYALDMDGDDRPDWIDSASGKAALKAPPSGRYEARLTVRNATGQLGRASAAFVSNARPRLALRVRNPKADMASQVEALLEAIDPDDSVRVLKVNFTGRTEDWMAADSPDTSKGPGKWRKSFRHAYGRAGAFMVEACMVSSNGRSACQTSRVEIFNAPPVCEPAADVKATLGVPAEIEGKGLDPDGSIVKWEWDLDGDGKFDVASRKDGRVKYTFAKTGVHSLTFRVTAADGATASAVRKVEVRKKWKG